MNLTQTAAQLGISRGQVSYSLRRGNVTLKKREGPFPTLSTAEVDGIISFIEASRESRRLTYLELASGPFKYLSVGERVPQKELLKRGFRCHPAHAKPPVSGNTRRMLKKWAEAHLHGTLDDWIKNLWTE